MGKRDDLKFNFTIMLKILWKIQPLYHIFSLLLKNRTQICVKLHETCGKYVGKTDQKQLTFRVRSTFHLCPLPHPKELEQRYIKQSRKKKLLAEISLHLPKKKGVSICFKYLNRTKQKSNNLLLS